MSYEKIYNQGYNINIDQNLKETIKSDRKIYYNQSILETYKTNNFTKINNNSTQVSNNYINKLVGDSTMNIHKNLQVV